MKEFRVLQHAPSGSLFEQNFFLKLQFFVTIFFPRLMATTYNWGKIYLFIYCSHYFSWIKKFCRKHPPSQNNYHTKQAFYIGKNFPTSEIQISKFKRFWRF
jgi:hypothetical protein